MDTFELMPGHKKLALYTQVFDVYTNELKEYFLNIPDVMVYQSIVATLNQANFSLFSNQNALTRLQCMMVLTLILKPNTLKIDN